MRGEILTEPSIAALFERMARVLPAARIAVLGVKTEKQSGQPAFYVPEYLVSAGFEVVPVPVYYPEVTTILGRPVFRTLASVPGELELVDVFRRPSDLSAHLDDIDHRHWRASRASP